MWVRSQDKEILVNALRIMIINKKIINAVLDDDYNTLGTYETKERAIEVLNYIQDNILDYEFAKGTHDAPKYIVFEMPVK